MTEQEQADLNKLREEQYNIMESAFSAMRDILRYSDSELRNTGHKTTGEALEYQYRHSQIRLDKLQRDYLRKYPD